MRRYLRVCFEGIAVILVFCVLGPAMGGTEVVAEPMKERFLLYEPLFLRVGLQNNGPGNATPVGRLHPGLGAVRVEITAPGESPHFYSPWVQTDGTREYLEASLVTLAAGDMYDEALDLTYEMRDGACLPVLAKEGDYLLRVSYDRPHGWPGDVGSATAAEVRVVVDAAKGADRGAQDILVSCPDHPHWPWNTSEQSAECYRAILSRAASSAYAPSAALYLAQVRESQAQGALRGTAEGRAAMEEAASLYLSVYAAEGDGPLGLYAKRLAARCRASLGEREGAQALLEQVLDSAEATVGDRVEALSWLGLLEEGFFERDLGYVSAPELTPVDIALRGAVEAIGLTASWQAASRSVIITGRGVLARLRPGDARMVVNGSLRESVRVALNGNHVVVSPSVIATLMAEQYGKGMANAFPPQMIARAAPER